MLANASSSQDKVAYDITLKLPNKSFTLGNSSKSPDSCQFVKKYDSSALEFKLNPSRMFGRSSCSFTITYNHSKRDYDLGYKKTAKHKRLDLNYTYYSPSNSSQSKSDSISNAMFCFRGAESIACE